MHRQVRFIIFVVLAAATAHATDRTWIGADNGIFSDPQNWTPGGVPVGPDQAFFNQLLSGPTVRFFNDPNHSRLIVSSQTWSFDLMGHLYTLTAFGPGSGVIVGSQPSTSAGLTLIGGDLVCINGIIASAGTSTGQVILNNANWACLGQLDVGSAGTAHLDVLVDSTVNVGSMRLAVFGGSSAQVMVHNPGSSITSTGRLDAGVLDEANIFLQFGTSLSNGDASLGVNAGARGDLFAGGADWTTTGDLEVGVSGEGEVTIIGTSDHTVSGTARIGCNTGSIGLVEVGGVAATWTVDADLVVGDSGSGTLDVTGGAGVGAFFATIGAADGGVGAVMISDAGSSLSSTSTLRVGADGEGDLEILNGATVTSAFLATIGDGVTGVGTVLVQGAASTWTNTGAIDVGDEGVGTLTLDGGRVEAGTIFVNDLSVVEGTGVLDASLSSSGCVRPGLSAGTLGVEGPVFTQAAPGVLEVEIGGTAAGTGYDQLAVTNAALLGGEMQVTLINVFVPIVGNAFDVLTAGTVSSTFDTVALPGLPADRAWEATYTSDHVRLEVIDAPPAGYRVSQWDAGLGAFVALGFIEPYETSLSVVDHYSLGLPFQAQANFPVGEAPELVNDRSHVFLLDSAIDGMHLVFAHDRSIVPLGGTGFGDAETQWTVEGDPDGAAWVVQDDPGEGGGGYTGNPGDTQFTADHHWGNFSDGGALGSMDGGAWAMEGRFTDVGSGPQIDGLTSWSVYSSDGTSIPLVLAEDTPLRIERFGAPCEGDLTGDGQVDVDDLLGVLGGWGTPAGDVTGDGQTDVDDLLAVLAGWGEC